MPPCTFALDALTPSPGIFYETLMHHETRSGSPHNALHSPSMNHSKIGVYAKYTTLTLVSDSMFGIYTCLLWIFIRHSVNQGDTLAHANYTWNIKIQSFTFSVLGYKLFETWMPKVTREELSNQRKSEKIVDSAEMKETELDVLHRQRNKGAKD